MLIMSDIYNTSEDINPIVTVSCLESICPPEELKTASSLFRFHSAGYGE